MSLQAVIVDDEPAGRQAVRDGCRACRDIEVLAECESGEDAIRVIQRVRPQIAFLDVQMKPVTGIEVAAQLPAEATPVVVFVTAYDQYAVRAFEVNAVDYLLKPFDAERFNRMLERVRFRLRDQLSLDARRDLRQMLLSAAQEIQASPRAEDDRRLIIEVGGRVSFVDPLDVESVEVDRNYVTISVGQHSYRVRATLADIDQRLTLPCFVRIHRSVIINTAMTLGIEKSFHGEYEIEMRSGRRFTSGRIYRQRIQGLVLRARGSGP